MPLIYFIVIMFSTMFANGEQPKLIIIGAGPSGIAAASKLFEYGFNDVTIIEAENRIGGRVHTTRFDKYLVDLGGQWVEGQTNNVAFDLASPLGLIEVPEERGDFVIVDSKGTLLPDHFGSNLTQLWDEVDNIETKNLNGGSNNSLGIALTAVLNNKLDEKFQVNDSIRSEIMILFEKLVLGSEAAESWDDLSISTISENHDYNDAHVSANWKDKGYSMILDILMKKYPDPTQELPVLNNSVLATEVVNVNYERIKNKAVVKTADGKEYIADHVIVTPSLGVLKAQHETLFTPALPQSKVNDIRGLGFGIVGKIYLSFETSWWRDIGTLFVLIWNEADRNEYESNENTKWLLDVVTFSEVEHKPTLLCAWLIGPGVRYMEALSDERVLNQTLALVKKFLGRDHNITTPTGVLRTKWYSNEHFRGTYSYRSIESDKLGASAEGLGKPLVIDEKPVVLFAGEATNPRRWGTVHGAIESGIREANRLKSFYNNTLV